MKNFIIISILLLLASCANEECVTCIAESKEGKIIETKSACDSSSKYLNGFVDGFKQKHQENMQDSINVQCTFLK